MRFEWFMREWWVPAPSMHDETQETNTGAIASTVNLGKKTSAWVSAFALGFLVGVYIGFDKLLSIAVIFVLVTQGGMGLQFLTYSVFSFGLMLVVITGAEMFTGSNLMVSSEYGKRQYDRHHGKEIGSCLWEETWVCCLRS